MKKLWLSTLLLLTLSLSGCQLFAEKQSPIPAEYAGAAYELSDSFAEKWAFSAKQAEQCIYPNLTRIQFQHFPKEDSFIYSQYVFFYPLEDIIGENNVKIIQDDEKAMGYANYQYKKFKTKSQVKNMDPEQCKILQTKARDDLAVVKGEQRSAMVEPPKEGEKQKNSTEENRFFFDIIKWGTTLFLL